jgi:hypothetical protein
MSQISRRRTYSWFLLFQSLGTTFKSQCFVTCRFKGSRLYGATDVHWNLREFQKMRKKVITWWKWRMSFQLYRRFNDVQMSWQPFSRYSEDSVAKVSDDRRLASLKVAEDGGIFWRSFKAIWTNDLVLMRVSTKFVPRLLTEEANEYPLSLSSYVSECTVCDGNFLKIRHSVISSWILKRMNTFIVFAASVCAYASMCFMHVSDGNKGQNQRGMFRSTLFCHVVGKYRAN